MSIFSKNKKIILSIFSLVILVSSLFFAGVTFAVGPNADTFGLGGLEQNLVLGGQDIRITIAKIINVFLGILGIVAISIIVYAGYVYMTAGGNDEKVTQARNWIKNAVIGLAIILSAFAIVTFVISKLAEATIGTDPRCNDQTFAAENPDICPDAKPMCPWNTKILATDPGCFLCGEKHFVVQSITPNTKNTQMNNVVVRALFSWPINEKYVTSSLELAKTVKVFSGTTDVTTKFDFSLIENKRVIELKPNSTSEQKCSDGSNCLPFGTYKVQVQPVQSETGQSLESGQLSCGLFLTEVNFIVGERNKQGNVNVMFDGITGGVTVPNSSDFDFANKNITLSFWIKMPAVSNSTSSIPTILDHFGGGSRGVGGGWYVVRNGEKLLFNHRSAVNGGDLMLTTNASVNDDKWHLVTYTLDGTSTAKVFIDGNFDKLGSYNNPFDFVTKNLFIGNMSGSMNYWQGGIDDIRIYNQILSSSTIASLYSYGKADRSHYLDGLISWWNFDESADQTNKTVIDYSNRGHNGTLKGNVLRQATPDFAAGGVYKDVTKPDLFDLKIDNSTSTVHSLRVSKFYRTYPVEAKIADDSGFSYAQLRVNEFTKVNGVDTPGALITQSVYYDGPLVVSSSDATVDNPYLLKLPLRLNEATYPNEKYIVTIEIHDIDNRTSSTSTIIDLTPDSCLDGMVGGVCGGGEGELCDYDTDCAYGFRCKFVGDDIKKTCTAYPLIEGVSPSMDGAVGNWVTVVGKNFGEDAGDIYFASGTEWIKAFNPCVNEDVWHDNWAVISVPGLSLDNIGAVKLKVANQTKIEGVLINKDDVTNDDFGLEPGIPGLFTINTTKRPGLCNVGITEAVLNTTNGTVVLPVGSNRGLVETEILASGQGLGTQRQNSSLWFGSGITKINSNINEWNDDTKVYAVVPSAAEVNNWYGVYAEIGGKKSNGIPFYIVDQAGLNGPIITSIEPASTTPGSFITIYGSRFGRNPGTVGTVWFARTQQDVLTCPEENHASSCFTANYADFPTACSDTWFDDHVIVGVPHDLFGAVFSNSVLNNLLALPASDNGIGKVDVNTAGGYVVNTFDDTIVSNMSNTEALVNNQNYTLELKFTLKQKPTKPSDNTINSDHDNIFGYTSNNDLDFSARFLSDNLGVVRFCFVAEQSNQVIGQVCDLQLDYESVSLLDTSISYVLIKAGNLIKLAKTNGYTNSVIIAPANVQNTDSGSRTISIGKVLMRTNEMTTNGEANVKYVLEGLNIINGTSSTSLLNRQWWKYMFVMTSNEASQVINICDSAGDPPNCVTLNQGAGSLYVNSAGTIKKINDTDKKFILKEGYKLSSKMVLLDIPTTTLGFTLANNKWSKERYLLGGYYPAVNSSAEPLGSYRLWITEEQKIVQNQRQINRQLSFEYVNNNNPVNNFNENFVLPAITANQLQNLEFELFLENGGLTLSVLVNGQSIAPEQLDNNFVLINTNQMPANSGAFWIGGIDVQEGDGNIGNLGLSYTLFNSLTLNLFESGDILTSARPFVLLKQNINDEETQAGLLSSGNNQVTVVDGEPMPGLCAISPTSGPAPLADGDELMIYGSNLSTDYQSNIFFDNNNVVINSKPSVGNGWLRTTGMALDLPVVEGKSGGQGITTTIPSAQNESGTFYSMRKNGPIFVQSNGMLSNSLPYDVIDCNLASSTEKTKMTNSGFQCCATSGTDLGKWKPNIFLCDNDKREAGYVWRFYTGKMPRLPSVVEECNEEDWGESGVENVLPSPVPSTKWEGSGYNACINSSIVVRFSMGMDEASFVANDVKDASNTVKLSTCEGDDKVIDCSGTKKQTVTIDTSDLLEGDKTLRIDPVSGSLLPNTWYRVELRSDIMSSDPSVELGVNKIFREHLRVDTTKQCGDKTNAYCFDFKTSADTCKLIGAGINPPNKTYNLLGYLQDGRYPFTYALSDVFNEARVNLFYYYLWGLGDQTCSVLDVDNMGWQWSETDQTVAEVIPKPCLGGASCPRIYTDSRATARANSESLSVVYFNASTTTSTVLGGVETYNATTTLLVNLTEPKIINWWPNCENACANGSIGVQFNMTMMTSTYPGALELYMCNNSTCTDTSIVPLSTQPDNLLKENILEVLPASDLERNTWYKVVIKNQIRAVGGYNGVDVKEGKLVPQFSWVFRTKEFDAQCILDRAEVEPNPFSALDIGEKTKYSAVPYSAPDNNCSTVGQRLNPWSFGWRWSVGDARVATTTNYETGFERIFNQFCTQSTCLPKGSDIDSSQLNMTDALCGNGVIDIGEDCDIDANIPGGSIKEVAGVSCNYNCLRSGNNILNEGIGESLYINGNFEDGLSGYEKLGVSYDSYLPSGGVFEPPDGTRVADISISLNSTQPSLIGQQIDNLNEEKIYTGSIFAFRNLIITTDLSLGIKSTSPDGTHVYFWNFISQNWDEAIIDGFGFPIFSSDQIKNFSIPQGVWSEYNYSVPNNKGSLTFYWGLTPSQKSNRKIYLDKAFLGINGKINTCGNGIVDMMSSEECDTGIIEQGAYCSNKCLWLGTGPFTGNAGPWCGDDLASIGKGEECDIVGPVTKVRCSSNCLHAGTTLTRSWCDKMGTGAPVECESAQSVCGNNHLETGEQCEIFGTSTLKFFVNDVVTSAIVSSTLVNKYCNSQCRFGNICGLTAIPLAGNNENKSLRCSDNPNINIEGCNDNCVLAGSDVNYSSPSLCANGKKEMGEYASCEVEPLTVQNSSLGENPIQTVTAVGEQPIIGDSAITAQTTTIFARAISYFDPNTTTKKVNLPVIRQKVGEGEYGLTCGYMETEDGNDCNGNLDNSNNVFGVAYNSCCYERPSRTAEYPKAKAIGVCRNTYLEFSFSGKVDESTLKDNVHLVRGYMNTTTCPVGSTDVSEIIITNTIDLAFAGFGDNNSKNSFFDKVINFFKKIFVWLWPTDLARAVDESYGDSEYKNNLIWCEGGTAMTTEVSYITREVLGEDGIYRSVISTSTISIQNNELLASSSYYAVILDGGLKGIKNTNGVGIMGYKSTADDSKRANQDLWIFKTSDDICKIKEITVEPKSHLFNVPLATTTLTATVHSENNQKIVTTTEYNWVWSWGPQNNTLLNIPAIAGQSLNDNSIVIGARNVEGFLSVIGQAEVASDGEVYYGNSDIRVKFCANPWPPLATYPYEDKMLNDDGFNTSTNHFDGSTIPSANGKYFNFNISYCADKGSPSTTTDDLPLLKPYVYTGGEKMEILPASNRTYTVIDNLVVTQDTLKRVLFFNNKNEDLIGLQIFKNPGRQTARNWFLGKFPQATGAGTVNVGGYEGVKDANNYYFNVFNIGENSKTVENFILQIGINTGAQGPTKEVFDQLIKSLTFNTNISDQHLCRTGTSGVFGSKRCDTDFDCYVATSSYYGDTCSADLTKFKRDWRRLADITAFQIKMRDFYQKNAFYPKLESGTYIRSYTVNRWPSWSELSSAVGGAPQDPLNIWVGCNAGADKQTCWVTSSTGSNVESYYSCPQKMSAYEYYYNNVSNTYSFYTPLEYFTKDIVLQNFRGEFIPKDAESSWIVNTPWCTSGTTFSPYYNRCGDGVINIASVPPEQCDPPGNTKAVQDGGAGSYSTWTCNSQCEWNVGVATSTYKCGNGIVEGVFGQPGGEACDDGVLNGTYGNCAVGCQDLYPQYCGDNILQPSLEMCEVKDNVLVSYGLEFGRKCINYPDRSCTENSHCFSALSFDGVSDYLTSVQNIPFSGSPVTVEFWYKPDIGMRLASTPLVVFHRADRVADSTDINDYFALEIGKNKNIGFGKAGYMDIVDQRAYLKTGNNVVSLHNWVHIAIVSDGQKNFKIFVNGAEVSSKTDFLIDDNFLMDKMYIGNPPYLLENGLTGTVDEFRIYNVALNSNILGIHYNNFMSNNTDDGLSSAHSIVGWHFDDGGGSDIYNYKKDINDATISGAKWVTPDIFSSTCGSNIKKYTYLRYGDQWKDSEYSADQCNSGGWTADVICAAQRITMHNDIVSLTNATTYKDKYCNNSGNVLVLCSNDTDCVGPTDKSFIFSENEFKTTHVTNLVNFFTNVTSSLGTCENLSPTKQFGAQYNFYRKLSCGYDCQNYGSYCGDGVVNVGPVETEPYEQCDDGNNINNDGCNAFCKVDVQLCGNKTVDTNVGETCDDGKQCTNNKVCTGNSVCVGIGDGQCKAKSGDGCSNICKIEIRTGKYCGNGVIEDAEKCDQGEEKNGVVCIPGYGKSCNYCSVNCDKVITRDSTFYCGNGKIDEVGGLNPDGSKKIEQCDINQSSGGIIRFNTSTGLVESLICPDRGKYECGDNCKYLSNNCTNCGFGQGGTTAKASFLNVVWPNLGNEEGVMAFDFNGHDGLVDLLYTKYPFMPYASTSVQFDASTPNELVLGKINTNPLCNYNSSDDQGINKGSTYKLILRESSIQSYVSTTPFLSILDYPVNNEKLEVNNEYVVSPPLMGPNQIRVVLHWTDKEDGSYFNLNVFSLGIEEANKHLSYLDEIAKYGLGRICFDIGDISSYNYNFINFCKANDRVVDGIYIHESGKGDKNGTQTMTIDTTDKDDEYLFFVDNTPVDDEMGSRIAKYLNSNLTMDIYKYKSGTTYANKYIYKPDQVISIKDRVQEGLVNQVADYWFAIKIDPVAYRADPTNYKVEVVNTIESDGHQLCLEAYKNTPGASCSI